MKIVGVILGAALLVLGVYCLVTPVETFAMLGWLIGFAMLVDGVSNALTWNERRKYGFADGWTLAGAIASIALGVLVLCSLAAQIVIDTILAYLVAAWLIIGGITRIAAAIGLRNLNKMDRTIGGNWLVLMLLGILVVAMGIACFIHPTFAMVGVGILLGLSIILAGCSVIAASLSR